MVTADDVCHTYALRAEGLDPQSAQALLEDFCRRWPEHAAGLRQFAAGDWHTADEIDDEPETEESRAVEETFVRRGTETARKLLEKWREK